MNARRRSLATRTRITLMGGAMMLLCLAAGPIPSHAAELAPKVKDLNTTREFPKIDSKDQWLQRAGAIREQVLASCGLSPMPTKTPLSAKVFGRVEREGYSIEKVYFQSYPGVYVAGNLYRPLGHGKGPFPGVLNPHGHWANGRMADQPDGSVAARCIHMARHGMVAFSYDMTGYNDTFLPDHGDTPASGFYARHRRFGTNQTDQLWNISLMGLQTWNSIRALDFLESLSDVDPKRLACTGESGGGTQTFMLGAIDTRLAVQAPVVMVSSVMQGGCSCENVPGLRVRYSNMEVAAVPVPRPQFLVAATGDWTRHTLSIEGPAIERIYGLFGKEECFDFVRFDFGHNYNQTSREAVYGWFNKYLLKAKTSAAVPEAPYSKEADADLRVFPDSKLPSDAVTSAQLVQYLKQSAQSRWEKLLPRSGKGLHAYRDAMFPGWTHALQVARPGTIQIKSTVEGQAKADASYEAEVWDKSEPERRIRVIVSTPGNVKTRKAAVIASSGGDGQESAQATELKRELLEKGWVVMSVSNLGATPSTNFVDNFYTTYNRTRAQDAASSLVLACEFARSKLDTKVVALCGLDSAGLWALLAAPAADAVVSDCRKLSTSSDSALLHPDVFCPGLRNIGGLEGVALMAAPNPLLLHNTASFFDVSYLTSFYGGAQKNNALSVHSEPVSDREILTWLANLP